MLILCFFGKQVRNQIIGKRGTYVTLSLRRFMPSTGEFSHVFETRIQRELHPAPLSPGHSSARDDQSAGPRQGPIINQMHENVDTRGTAQPLDPSSVSLPMLAQGLVCCWAPRWFFLSRVVQSIANGTGGIGIQLMDIDQVLMVRSLDHGGPAER